MAYQRFLQGIRFLFLPLCWAVIANCAHLSTIVYGVPAEFFTIIIPIAVGIHIGWTTGPKKGLLVSMAFLFFLSTLVFLTLDLPVLLGILDKSYASIFEFFNMLKVLRSIIVVSFFTVISEIFAFLVKNR